MCNISDEEFKKLLEKSKRIRIQMKELRKEAKEIKELLDMSKRKIIIMPRKQGRIQLAKIIEEDKNEDVKCPDCGFFGEPKLWIPMCTYDYERLGEEHPTDEDGSAVCEDHICRPTEYIHEDWKEIFKGKKTSEPDGYLRCAKCESLNVN